MKSFSKLQREEILYKIQMRRETVEMDPESGSEFEKQLGFFDRIEKKINNGQMDFEFEEGCWLKEELENCEDIAWGNYTSDGIKVLGYAGSMRNAINKLEQ